MHAFDSQSRFTVPNSRPDLQNAPGTPIGRQGLQACLAADSSHKMTENSDV
jgi:hypothetical protein